MRLGLCLKRMLLDVVGGHDIVDIYLLATLISILLFCESYPPDNLIVGSAVECRGVFERLKPIDQLHCAL